MKTIKIIFTGGTIAMKKNTDGLLIPAVSGDELIGAIPALREIAKIKTQQLSNIPSAQMSPAICLQLRTQITNDLSHNDIYGVVVVHGTDTLEETAFFLDSSLSNQALNGKTVVLTGAMRSADEEQGDGPNNLLAAVTTAASPQANGRGVLVTMANTVHPARWVQKMESNKTDAFSSPNAPEHILGSIQNGTLSFPRANIVARAIPIIDIQHTARIPRVDIINMHSGADDVLLKASIDAGAGAVVVNAVGAGNVNLELFEAIRTTINQGIPIIISTRSASGGSTPSYGYPGGGKTLLDAGACFAHDLSAQKARIYAQLLLMQTDYNQHTIKEAFKQLTQPNQA